MNSGIYKILNKVNGKFYIGSSVTLKRRHIYHFSSLRCARHPNRYLQAAWNKYGEEAFEFIILETCEKQFLLIKEQSWLNWTKSYNREIGYNLFKIAGSPASSTVSKETRLKISLASKGRKASEETKRKMSAWQIGRKMTDQAKQNMINAKQGNSYRRDISKWPCADGCECRCDICRLKRKKRKKIWDIENKGIKTFIMIEQNTNV